MEGHDHRQIEGHFPAVVGDEAAPLPVDGAGVELGDELDALLLQHSAQLRGGHRFGERAVERGHVGELDAVADAPLGEVPVGEEAELEWRDRALDRHVDHVHDDAAAVEVGQCPFQRGGTLEAVEGEHLVHPSGTGQTLGFVGDEHGTSRDHEHVVAEDGAVGEVHLIAVEVDVVDGRDPVGDVAVELVATRPDDVFGMGQPERHEQQRRLVDVAVVLVDHRDLELGGREQLAQAVGGQGPAGAPSEDDHMTSHVATLCPRGRLFMRRRRRGHGSGLSAIVACHSSSS